MSLKRLCLFSALLLLLNRGAGAQPGGVPSRFSALETCNVSYLNREHVFVGRVMTLEWTPNPNRAGDYAWKATVEVETSLKGQTGREVELILLNFPPTSDQQVKGKRFIFTATRIVGRGFSGLFSDKWSTPLDDVPPDVMSKVLDGIRDVLRGLPQPPIVGTVREQSWGISFVPGAGRPLPDVVIVAESKDGRQFTTHTDAEGYFQFDALPFGMYTLRPLLSETMALYDMGFERREESGKKYLQVDERLCSRELHFIGQEAGNIAGSIRREKGNWAFGKPLMYLYRINPESHKIDFAATLVPSDVSLSETDAENLIRFSFYNVPVGSYVLSISNIDPSGQPETIYYPGVSDIKDAGFINVSTDNPTEVMIELPSLQQRRIYGRAHLPDGTPVNATVLFVHVPYTYWPDTPIESLSAYDFTGSMRTTAQDGQFEFRYWEGRRLKLYAYFDGAKDGARVRFFGQTRSLLVNGDIGPINITLDRSEPLK